MGAKDLRLISLTSIPLKQLKKLVNRLIGDTCISKWPPYRRPIKSTGAALHELRANILMAISILHGSFARFFSSNTTWNRLAEKELNFSHSGVVKGARIDQIEVNTGRMF